MCRKYCSKTPFFFREILFIYENELHGLAHVKPFRCLLQNAQHEKEYLHITFKAGLREQRCVSIVLFVAIVLFSIIKSFPWNLSSRSLKYPSSVSKLDPRNLILDPRKSKIKTWSSKIKTRFSILENFEYRESSFKSRLSTYLWVVLYVHTCTFTVPHFQVYYHLGAYDDSLTYALGAGDLFDVNGHSEYVETIIGKVIMHVHYAGNYCQDLHVHTCTYMKCHSAYQFFYILIQCLHLNVHWSICKKNCFQELKCLNKHCIVVQRGRWYLDGFYGYPF